MNLSIDNYYSEVVRAALKDKEALLEKQLSTNPLYVEIVKLRELLTEIDEQFKQKKLYGSPISVGGARNNTVFNPSWSASKKAEFILNEEKRGLTTKEIADLIVIKQPDIDRKVLVGNLSAVLGTKASEGKTYYREKNSDDENVYYLIEWKNNNEKSEPVQIGA